MQNVVIERKILLTSPEGISWADTMVLNPAIIKDLKINRIHMLVHTTGPYNEKRIEGRPSPYPIFIAYRYSDDGVKNI